VHAHLTMVFQKPNSAVTVSIFQPMETPRLKSTTLYFVRIRRLALPSSNDGVNMVQKEETTWL
jgi:hypothetical protein